jgi:hypothetical protein
MARFRLHLGLALAFLASIGPPTSVSEGSSSASSDRARAILMKVDDLWRGTSSYAVILMQVKTEHYVRTMRMEGWSRGQDDSLVRILSPLKEKGTATLKSGKGVYTYLPKTDRTIRLTSGMMMGSWMGSHFTNDDLVKESRLSDDYESEISSEGKRDGSEVIELTLMPKPDAAVVWGKIVISVRAKDLIPIVADYYDEEMELVRKMTFSRLETMGDRLVPTVLRLTPSDKPGEFTELVYEKLQFGVELDETFFSLANLRRGA